MPTYTDKIDYAASQAIAITLAALAYQSAQQCTPIDNTSNKFVDASVTLNITASASTVGGSNAAYLYFFGSEDGTGYDNDGAAIGPADAAYNLATPSNLKGPVALLLPVASHSYSMVVGSVAAFFGGILPKKWGCVVLNDSGQAFSAGSMSYTGINYTNS